MLHKKRGFFEKLSGSMKMDDDEEDFKKLAVKSEKENNNDWMEDENEEAELTVDVYQTPTDVIVQTMVAGVKPEDIELVIARDMVTIRGKREESRKVEEENYFSKELYWGAFSRTILLPQEIDPEEAEATEKHGLLTIKLPKIDKEKKTSVKVKSL
ncbi:MAG TPA: Hsp20/alpha crystallin family protein [Candidatus Paceibacterota bacterium]|nr:Hsp20/alpha crystallin family protein [Candidatus Paceibacterota bacterium]